MTTRADYTDEEWTYITAAPMMAGLYISAVAGSRPIDTMKEAAALAHAVGELVHRGSANELIGTLIAEINRKQGEALQTRVAIAIDVTTLDALHAATLDTLQKAAAVLSKAKREEAAEYKALVMSLSQRVAQAGNEGGFLGTGGTPVSEREVRAIQEIGAALRRTA
jgi:hypothetical protein